MYDFMERLTGMENLSDYLSAASFLCSIFAVIVAYFGVKHAVSAVQAAAGKSDIYAELAAAGALVAFALAGLMGGPFGLLLGILVLSLPVWAEKHAGSFCSQRDECPVDPDRQADRMESLDGITPARPHRDRGADNKLHGPVPDPEYIPRIPGAPRDRKPIQEDDEDGLDEKERRKRRDITLD